MLDVNAKLFWWAYRVEFGESATRYMKGLLEMAGLGKKFNFHGSFSSKAAAVKKEGETPGAFIRERYVSGKLRYFVLTPKEGKK